MSKLLFVLTIIIAGLYEYEVLANYHLVEGNQYYISTPLRKNWYQAHRDCLQKEMHLVDPRDQKENDIIIDLLRSDFDQNTSHDRNKTNYWTSGTDHGSYGTYYWMTNGDVIGFDHFRYGYPDQIGVEHCLEYKVTFDFKWNDVSCEQRHYFICRAKKLTP